MIVLALLACAAAQDVDTNPADKPAASVEERLDDLDTKIEDFTEEIDALAAQLKAGQPIEVAPEQDERAADECEPDDDHECEPDAVLDTGSQPQAPTTEG